MTRQSGASLSACVTVIVLIHAWYFTSGARTQPRRKPPSSSRTSSHDRARARAENKRKIWPSAKRARPRSCARVPVPRACIPAEPRRGRARSVRAPYVRKESTWNGTTTCLVERICGGGAGPRERGGFPLSRRLGGGVMPAYFRALPYETRRPRGRRWALCLLRRGKREEERARRQGTCERAWKGNERALPALSEAFVRRLGSCDKSGGRRPRAYLSSSHSCLGCSPLLHFFSHFSPFFFFLRFMYRAERNVSRSSARNRGPATTCNAVKQGPDVPLAERFISPFGEFVKDSASARSRAATPRVPPRSPSHEGKRSRSPPPVNLI